MGGQFKEGVMPAKRQRDVEKSYPKAAFVAKLRRFADAIERGDRFSIQIAGERITVPAKAHFTQLTMRSDVGYGSQPFPAGGGFSATQRCSKARCHGARAAAPVALRSSK